MFSDFLAKSKFFINCFILACFKNRFTSIFLAIYLCLVYWFQVYPPVSISKTKLFLLMSFIRPIQSSILFIIKAPIGNSAIEIARNSYLYSVLKNTKEKYQKYENSITAIKFKRIEIILSGIERDFVDFIQDFPLACINIYRAILLGSLYTNFYLTSGILNLSILISAFSMWRWPQIRKVAFEWEEKLASKVALSLNNYKLSCRSSQNLNEYTSVNRQDIASYQYAMQEKSMHKILTSIPGIILVFMNLSLENLIEQPGIYELFLFCLNFPRASISLISIVALSQGLYIPEEKKNIIINDKIMLRDCIIKGLKNPISLEMSRGEKIAVVGRNGSGKTMFCRTITGNQSIISGEINFPESSILVDSENYLFESDFIVLLDELSREDSILDKDKYKILLENKNLSKGQRNFFSAILALRADVDLVVFDETLDLISADMLEDLKKFIQNSSKIVVVTSHRKNIINWFEKKIDLNGNF